MCQKDKEKKENETEAEKTIFTKTQVQEMLEKIEGKYDKKLEMLEQVADRKKMAIYAERNRGEMPSKMKLRRYNKKIVVSSELISNEVFQDPISRAWKEQQLLELRYLDGSKETVDLLIFARNYNYVDTTLVKTIENEDKTKSFEVQIDKTDTKVIIHETMIN